MPKNQQAHRQSQKTHQIDDDERQPNADLARCTCDLSNDLVCTHCQDEAGSFPDDPK